VSRFQLIFPAVYRSADKFKIQDILEPYIHKGVPSEFQEFKEIMEENNKIKKFFLKHKKEILKNKEEISRKGSPTSWT